MQNIQLEQYGLGVLRVLVDVDDGIIERQDFNYANDNSVRLTASIAYHDDSRIRIRLIVNTDSDYPEWYSYSFHYMTAEDATIFRYDNARHYPAMHTFPHHKHIGASASSTARSQPFGRYAMRQQLVSKNRKTAE